MIPAFIMAWLDKALEKVPWIAKVPFYISLFLVWLLFKGFEYGAKVPAEAEAWFDQNYERNAAPRRALNNERLERIEENTRETREDIRDIRNYLMGRSKENK